MEDVLADSRTGDVLDERYRIIEPIAAGGMGMVYRAERLGLGRFVAVKFLTDVNSEQALARFEREARAMSRLNHPHVVSVIDFGVSKTPYIVMEYVTGRPLHELIALGPADAARAIHIMRQLVAGLAHAHGHGIIHRDIKPANVMLTEATGTGDYVRILDFGLAKLKGGESLSASNMVVGTPSYMAPEQSRGEEEDGRSDLYASGVLFFELLKGQKPFIGTDALQTLRMHQKDPIPPLGQVRGASLELTAAIDAVVQRALAKDPDDRYQSALEMGDALGELAEQAKAAQRARRKKRETEAKGKRTKAKTDVGRARTIPVDSADVSAFEDSVSTETPPPLPESLPPLPEPREPKSPEPERARSPEVELSLDDSPTIEPLEDDRPAFAAETVAPKPAEEVASESSRSIAEPRRGGGGGLLLLLLLVGGAAAGYWWWNKRSKADDGATTAVKPVERRDAGETAPPHDAAVVAIAKPLDAAAPIDAAADDDAGLNAAGLDAGAAALIDGGPATDAGDTGDTGDGDADDGDDDDDEPDSADAADAGPAKPAPALPPRPAVVNSWRDVKALIARNEKGAAVIGLRKLIRKYPKNAFLKLRLGHLYFERTAWTLGLIQYDAALRLSPKYKKYNTVNTNAIRALGAPSTRWRAHRLITRVIGRRYAMPYLKREARINKSSLVRKRAAALVKRFR